MPMVGKRWLNYYKGSAIKQQREIRRGARTKSGKYVGAELSKIKVWLFGKSFGLTLKQFSTIVVFCQNYFLKKGELPSRKDLRKIFEF